MHTQTNHSTYQPIHTSLRLPTPTKLYPVKPKHNKTNHPTHQPIHTSHGLPTQTKLYPVQLMHTQTNHSLNQPIHTSQGLPGSTCTNQRVSNPTYAQSDQPTNTATYPHQPESATPSKLYQVQPKHNQTSQPTHQPTHTSQALPTPTKLYLV